MNPNMISDAHYLRPVESKSLSLMLLGVPTATHRAQPVELARRQTRAILYRLGASMEPVARETLVGMFWPETEDGTARRNLARVLNLLRTELPHPDLLDISPMSVCLNRDLVWSDSHAMVQMCSGNNLAAYVEAVNLYRGSFLSGFVLRSNAEFDSWQASVQGQMERLCLDTLSKLIQHRIDSGDYWSAIRFGRRYLEIDSLAESVHCRLITLYALVGERGMATRQFEECVMVLDRELGVDPLPETRMAFEAATGAEAPSTIAVAPPPPDWHTLPSLHLPLIGRERAKQQLEDATARLSRGGFVFVVGEPGMGKSRLLKEFTSEQDALVLVGHSHSGKETVPYHPIVEALRQAIAGPLFGQGIREVWLTEAARLLPEISERFPALPRPLDADPVQGQARLFEALVQILHGLSTRRQVFLCFDDLHWVDDPTLAWLKYAATRFQASRICVLATSRSEEVSKLAPLQRLLQRSGIMTTVELEPWTPEIIAEVLQAVKQHGRWSPSAVDRVYQATGGNAFFVLELIRHLFETDHLENPPEPIPLPTSIQETIQRRIGRLSSVTRQILEAASVLSPNLDVSLLHWVTGRSELEVADGLDELLQNQMLHKTNTCIAFQHTLVETAVYQSLTDWRKSLLHRRSAEALILQADGREIGPMHAIVARHYSAAGSHELAVQHYLLAAESAQQISAASTTAGYTRSGIASLPAQMPDKAAAGLYEAMLGSMT